MYAGANETLVYGTTSVTSLFELPDFGNTALGTYPCRVELKVNAPDPARSKGPTTYWVGECRYHAISVR